jgi:hypothetical protein
VVAPSPEESHSVDRGDLAWYVAIPLVLAGLYLVRKLSRLDAGDVTAGDLLQLVAVGAVLGLAGWLIWKRR